MGIEQVNKAVMQLDELTQQNAALVEEASAASQAMADQARGLNGAMQRYRVRAAGSESAPAAASLPEAARTKAGAVDASRRSSVAAQPGPWAGQGAAPAKSGAAQPSPCHRRRASPTARTRRSGKTSRRGWPSIQVLTTWRVTSVEQREIRALTGGDAA